MTNGEFSVSGGSTEAVPKGKRLVAAIIDLIAVPIVLGIVAGVALIAIPENVRNIALVALNVIWLIVRDSVFAPGRKLVGLKLISLSGDRVTVGQAFIRNIQLIIPFYLLLGYVIETVLVFWKGDRLADRWAKTRVVNA